MAEIALRPGVGAIGADAGFGDVEINLHDPPLAPDILDEEGEPGFGHFAGEAADRAAALPEEGIFGGLLADSRAATHTLALRIALHRFADRGHIKTIVATEIAVLCGDGGAGHVGVHIGQRHPVAFDRVAVDQHGHRRWRRNHRVEQHPGNRQADEPEQGVEGEAQGFQHDADVPLLAPVWQGAFGQCYGSGVGVTGRPLWWRPCSGAPSCRARVARDRCVIGRSSARNWRGAMPRKS